jgi:hypothetical protein
LGLWQQVLDSLQKEKLWSSTPTLITTRLPSS